MPELKLHFLYISGIQKTLTKISIPNKSFSFERFTTGSWIFQKNSK